MARISHGANIIDVSDKALRHLKRKKIVVECGNGCDLVRMMLPLVVWYVTVDDDMPLDELYRHVDKAEDRVNRRYFTFTLP